jgi:hypothetical protein
VIYFCNRNIGEKDIASANNWKVLNPDYEIKLYDDKMIRTFLLKEYGELYLTIFDFLRDGPIKADFWRLCVLYKYGGVYSDIDNMPLVKLSDFVEDVDFVTCTSYGGANYNPNFIVAPKDSVILKNCIDVYVHKYIHKHPYAYWEWSIMNTLTYSMHLDNYKKQPGIYSCDKLKVQIILECPGNYYYDAHNIYNNIRVFNNRQPGWNSDLHRFN